MDKIPTAQEFLEKQEWKIAHNLDRDGIAYPSTHCEDRMIAFTKFHVEAALKAAAEQAKAKENPADYGTGEIWVDKDSILSAYPLNLIQ